MELTCDVFCTVVDNLGDAGVCWRLSRQLAQEHAWRIRLWIDQLEPLSSICHDIDPLARIQLIQGVEIRTWPSRWSAIEPNDVVIESFACQLPDDFIHAMAKRQTAPIWINLEYLSAETWVSDYHGLPSPHPTLPLVKYFFFPGFDPATGGLIREMHIATLAPTPCTWPETDVPLRVSMFCYENQNLPELLGSWVAGTQAIRCRVADGLPRRQIEHWLAQPFPVGTHAVCGSLHLEAAALVEQDEFDRQLMESDLNFVRGEDSFVRAQWAQRPFVWQIYPQENDHHLIKLEAFIDRYRSTLSPSAEKTCIDFWRAWNGHGNAADLWPAFRAVLPSLHRSCAQWAQALRRQTDLATNLVNFCRARI